MGEKTAYNQYYFYIAIYFALALIIAPTNLLHFDTYYYWDWSRHLALSYYDGPPLIALIIKGSTFLFGDTLFALSIIGITGCAITSILIYKTAHLFLDKEASRVAAMLWLFSPAVFIDLLIETTYDMPLTVFWALSLYYAVKYITQHQTSALYLTGVSLGLMMLSKYSGIVLVLSMIIFLIMTPYRRLFKTTPIYVAILILIILFSPVLLWNYQHQWISFLYQLNAHQSDHSGLDLSNVMRTIFEKILPVCNVMLVMPCLVWMKKWDKESLAVSLCQISCVVFLIFYIVVSGYALVRVQWLTQYLITASLLMGVYFQKQPKARRMIYALVTVYWVLSLIFMMVNYSEWPFASSRTKSSSQFVQHFNEIDFSLPETTPILTSDWLSGRMAFFLKNKPNVYTLKGCGPENQYAIWSTDIARQIENRSIHGAVYFSTNKNIHCLSKYFDKCSTLYQETAKDWRGRESAFFAYYCTVSSL